MALLLASASGTSAPATAVWRRRLRFSSDRAQAPRENGLLRMKAVFRLIEYNGLRAVDHLIRHLLAAMGGQAMHEQRVLAGLCHQSRVDLIGLEDVVTTGPLLLIHGNPGIGHHAIDAGYRTVCIMAEHDFGALVAGPVQIGILWLRTKGHCHIHAVAEAGGTFDQRMQHVVAVAGPGNGLALDRPAVLLEGHDV